MKDALGHGSNPRGTHSEGIAQLPRKLMPGDEITNRRGRWKIKATDWPNKTDNEYTSDHVLAWRWIGTTQKFSGNAYVIRKSDK